MQWNIILKMTNQITNINQNTQQTNFINMQIIQNRNQTETTQFINQQNKIPIRNQRYLDQPKKNKKIRMISINTNGMRSNYNEKMQYFIEVCNRYQIDCFLIIEMNTKWNTTATNKLKGSQ